MLKLLHTTNTSVIGKHEVLIFNDGHMEIEDLQINFEEDRTLDHICLDELEQYRLYLVLREKFIAQTDGRA